MFKHQERRFAVSNRSFDILLTAGLYTVTTDTPEPALRVSEVRDRGLNILTPFAENPIRIPNTEAVLQPLPLPRIRRSCMYHQLRLVVRGGADGAYSWTAEGPLLIAHLLPMRDSEIGVCNYGAHGAPHPPTPYKGVGEPNYPDSPPSSRR